MKTTIPIIIRKKIKENPYVYTFVKSAQRRVFPRTKRSYLKRVKNIFKEINLNKKPKKIEIPRIAMLGVTNICDLDCLMCQTNNSKRPKGFMHAKVFEKLLQELKKININSLGISIQGETFLHKNLEDLVEITEQYGFSLWLSTNGQFPEKIESLHKRFPHTINYYRVSIDGATKETYEHIRQGASFAKLLETLEVVRNINKNTIDSRITLVINTVLSMANIYELPLFFKLLEKYCYMDNIFFSIIDSVAPDTSFFRENFPFKNLLKKGVPCHRPFETLNFTYSGGVTMCCEDYSDELVVGNIENKTIYQIWDGEHAEIVRKKHLNPKEMDIEICRNCYRPYGFVLETINEYIHFLYDSSPSMPSREFGEKVVSLLKSLDNSMQKKNMEACKKMILQAFA